MLLDSCGRARLVGPRRDAAAHRAGGKPDQLTKVTTPVYGVDGAGDP